MPANISLCGTAHVVPRTWHEDAVISGLNEMGKASFSHRAACWVGLWDLNRLVCQNELWVDRTPPTKMLSRSSEGSTEMESKKAVARSEVCYTSLDSIPCIEQSSHRISQCLLPVQAPLLYYDFSLSVGSLCISLTCESKDSDVTCCTVLVQSKSTGTKNSSLAPCWGEQTLSCSSLV